MTILLPACTLLTTPAIHKASPRLQTPLPFQHSISLSLYLQFVNGGSQHVVTLRTFSLGYCF